MLDPGSETAASYRPNQAPKEISSFGQAISAGPALPGFGLDLRSLRSLRQK